MSERLDRSIGRVDLGLALELSKELSAYNKARKVPFVEGGFDNKVRWLMKRLVSI